MPTTLSMPPATPANPAPRGKVLVLLVVLMPALLGVLGLLIDGSRLMTESGAAQHAADAGAIAAAAALARGASDATAVQRAREYVQEHNTLAGATVEVSIPPANGPYAGRAGFVEVRVAHAVPTTFIHVLNGQHSQSVGAAAVAGRDAATAGAAVMVLDPDPPAIELPVIPGLTLPAMPPHHLGGLEVLGVGQLTVDGAVLVNTEWGGVDENGEPAGESQFPRSAVTCTPILPLTKLRARDIRVVGGVDDEENYGHYTAGETSPLRANALPVRDPLLALPVPTVAADPVNVSSTLRGGVTVVGLPLIGPATVLQPGVYEYIQIVSGRVIFETGVYVIRGRNPLTNIPVQIIGGEVTADGVMFYITDSAAYSPASGFPDANDGETPPVAPGPSTILPSAVINVGLVGSRFTPLDAPGSPYDGVFLFQRRADRRVIVLARDTLLAGGSFRGTIYAKWGHLVVAGMGAFDTRFVVGSLRFVMVLDSAIQPTLLLPPASDVFLVQ